MLRTQPRGGDERHVHRHVHAHAHVRAAGATVVYTCMPPEPRSRTRVVSLADTGVGRARAQARELQAIESEHSKNLQSDSWRLQQLHREIAHPEHPWHRFASGNLATLSDAPERLVRLQLTVRPGAGVGGARASVQLRLAADRREAVDVRRELLRFHREHYCSSRMGLALMGKEPLDQLMQWAVPLFGAVPRLEAPPLTYPCLPYPDERLGRLLRVVPMKDTSTVGIGMCMLHVHVGVHVHVRVHVRVRVRVRVSVHVHVRVHVDVRVRVSVPVLACADEGRTSARVTRLPIFPSPHTHLIPLRVSRSAFTADGDLAVTEHPPPVLDEALPVRSRRRRPRSTLPTLPTSTLLPYRPALAAT